MKKKTNVIAKAVWFEVRAAVKNSADVYIYDEIGFWGIGAKQFIDAIKELGAVDRINLHINSPGGEVFDGFAIYNFLSSIEPELVVYIDGLAASMASVVAMAGDEIIMPDNAMMMIHNPWSIVAGNQDELRDWADTLEKMANSIARIYEKQTGLDIEDIKELMSAETWLSAEEAKEKGFATTTTEAVAMAASFNVEKVRNIPDQLKAQLKQEQKKMDKKDKNKAKAEAAEQAAKEETGEDGEKKEAEEKPTNEETTGTDGNEGTEGTESKSDADEAGADSGEGDDTENTDGAADASARVEFRQFVDLFGHEAAGRYYADGLTLDEAKSAHIKEQSAEIAKLKAVQTAGDKNDGAEGVEFDGSSESGAEHYPGVQSDEYYKQFCKKMGKPDDWEKVKALAIEDAKKKAREQKGF